MRGQQLALSVQLRDTASFHTFFAGPNAAAVSALQPPLGSVVLYGTAQSGRTHLLQAIAREYRAMYLPLHELTDSIADLFEGLDDTPMLCLDDLDSALTTRDDALTVMRLLDARHLARLTTVVALETHPDRLPVVADLRTRLMRGTLLGLKPFGDDDRQALLMERAARRGLQLPVEVSRWLLQHLPRDVGALLDALQRLDHASLTAQRRLTLPFVQSVLLPAARAPESAQTTPPR